MNRRRSRLRRATFADYVIFLGVLILAFVSLYPFIYCLSYSLSSTQGILIKRVYFLPVEFTVENYKIVFRNPTIMPAFGISVTRTVLGVLYTCSVTGLASYSLSKHDMPARRALALFLLIPMYINGGMIATYVNIYQLGLFNKFAVYILPAGFVTFYMLIMRTYFDSLPVSMEESAKLDGAGNLTVFLRIILPLSMPIFATVALLAGVSQWNSWFDAMVYTQSASLRPLQMVLQGILMQNSAATMMRQAVQEGRGEANKVSPETIQMATLVITTVPIVCIYPFLQRYFVKGIMIGAVKA